MVLGISYGQLAVIVGVAVAFSGPKDILNYARTAGRLLGRAVGYVKAARGELDTVLQRAQVNEVHKELQETMAQLDAIRYEIRSGLSIMGNTPATRQIFDSAPPVQAQQEVKPHTTSSTPNTMKAFNEEFLSAPQKVHHMYGDECSRGVEFVKMEVRHSLAAKHPKTADVENEITVLPVSAAAANRVPPRTGPTVGADIILEALEERKVASHALDYFKQSNQPTDKDQ